MPKIVEAYGRESIKIEKNFIVVTIPFNRINVTPFELNEGQPTVNPTAKATVNPTVKMSKNQRDIMAKIADNPRITLTELSELLGLHRATIADNTSKLQKLGVLKRIGSDKTGYWEIVE